MQPSKVCTDLGAETRSFLCHPYIILFPFLNSILSSSLAAPVKPISINSTSNNKSGMGDTLPQSTPETPYQVHTEVSVSRIFSDIFRLKLLYWRPMRQAFVLPKFLLLRQRTPFDHEPVRRPAISSSADCPKNPIRPRLRNLLPLARNWKLQRKSHHPHQRTPSAVRRDIERSPLWPTHGTMILGQRRVTLLHSVRHRPWLSLRELYFLDVLPNVVARAPVRHFQSPFPT